jgi:hypothetical protein
MIESFLLQIAGEQCNSIPYAVNSSPILSL